MVISFMQNGSIAITGFRRRVIVQSSFQWPLKLQEADFVISFPGQPICPPTAILYSDSIFTLYG